MKNRTIYLARESLEQFPEYDIPTGYHIELMDTSDLSAWYEIQRAAEPFIDIQDGLLEAQSGERFAELANRCFFLLEGTLTVGTGTAWWEPNVFGERWGRLRWFAIRPSHQGAGLSKPLLTRVLHRVSQTDTKCYLETSTQRVAAVNLYLSFGFRPKFESEEGRRIWRELAQENEHPALCEYR